MPPKSPKKKVIKGELIEGTSGVILNGIYYNKQAGELLVCLAWGGNICFNIMLV